MGLVGNHAGIWTPSILEQLLEDGQDTPKTLKKCEVSMFCQPNSAPCML